MLTFLGPGTASAEPQLPRITQYSEDIGTFGDHSYCRGAFRVGMVAPNGKRGVVRLTLTSHGFTGDGASWRRDPNCRFITEITIFSATVVGQQTSIPVAFGPRRGEKVVRDIRTGSGPVSIGVLTYPSHNPVRLQQSFGAAFYTIVP
ncbi:enoyl-CoA hydratase [Gordonia sesuvii]